MAGPGRRLEIRFDPQSNTTVVSNLLNFFLKNFTVYIIGSNRFSSVALRFGRRNNNPGIS